MSERVWYVVGEDRRRHGPLTTAELAQFSRGGNAGPRSWAWREGLELWVPLAEAVGGRIDAPPSPPPTPAERPKAHGKSEPKPRANSAANAAARQAENLLRHAREDAEAAVRVRAAEAKQVAATKAQAAINAAQQQAMTNARQGCRKVMRFFGFALFGLIALGVLISQLPEATDAVLDEIGAHGEMTPVLPAADDPSAIAPSAPVDPTVQPALRAALAPYLDAIAAFRRETDRCPSSLDDLGLPPADGETMAAPALLETSSGQCVLRVKIGRGFAAHRGQRIWWLHQGNADWACRTDHDAPTLPPCDAGPDPTLGTAL